MTTWIIGPRQSGRSTELIQMAAAMDLLIVTGDYAHANCLWKMAQDMGETIRRPEPLSAWLRKPHLFFDYKGDHPGILVDDADFVLSRLLRTNVIAAVIESDDYCNVQDLRDMGIEV